MALQSGLTLWAYPSPTLTSFAGGPVAYQQELENLSFGTVAPGGFGNLEATIKLADPRLPRPELQLFSRVALMGHGENGPFCVFLGEIMEAPFTVTEAEASVALVARGIGNALRDDPLSIAYSLQTPKQVATDEITAHNRPNFLPIDQDMSAVFPDNPAATISPSYDARNIEDILNDITTLAGDCIWGVWAHQVNKDAGNFPTAQLQVHLRDTATVNYRASFLEQDIVSATVAPVADRAYNVIKIGYNSKQNGFGTATYTDPRLGAGGVQGSAPFRRRAMVKDMSGTTSITSTDAQNIANLYGALYQNITNKVTFKLRSIKDAQSIPLPPWTVRADANIAVPDLAQRGVPLPTTLTAGVNQFYILSTSYAETATDWTLTMECDNFHDSAQQRIARLQLIADLRARAGKTNGAIQMLGASEQGYFGIEFTNAIAAHPSFGHGVIFQQIMAQAPTSLTLSADSGASNYNTTTPAIDRINSVGFRETVTCNFSAGDTWGRWYGWYTTVGNCLHEIHHEQARLDWHCDGCDTLHPGLLMAEHVEVLYPCPTCHDWHGHLAAHPALHATRKACRDTQGHGAVEAGSTALAITCPGCLSKECFNTALSSADEDVDSFNNYAKRANDARLIRQLMAHPVVGLRTRE